MKIVPIITCSPCSPVEAKNTVPNTESAIEKGALIYSNACKLVNTIAKMMQIKAPIIAPFLSPLISA